MKTKYDVFLRMKNAKADGVYDFDTQTLLVKEGAIFEEEISESFRKHPYLKHRRELLDSEAVEDFRLIQDYEFNSPSAAAAIIVGRPMGPQDWKTSEGITLKRLIERRERLDDFKSFINENKHFKADETYLQEIKEFKKKFPLEKIKNLTLEEYDKTGSRDTFTYYIEWKTRVLSGGMFGALRNKLFFMHEGRHKNAKFIENKHPDKTVQERFDIFKNELHRFVKDFDEKTYSWQSYDVLPEGANFIKSKLINIYHPGTIFSIDSSSVLYKILDYFVIKYPNTRDSVTLNILLKKRLMEDVPGLKEMNMKDLSELLWRYYEEKINIEEEETETETPYIDPVSSLFMPDETIDDIVFLLKNKKNIILQGAPGVGKTFSIKKIINSKFDIDDPDKQIKMVQFHQSFSYEEFIEGLRPTAHDAGFVLEDGIFKSFIEEEVMKDTDRDYFLIIDEINRGNLSKIFGELMLLIEKENRDVEKVVLPYSNKEFYVPSNLYIIGTMNTADRSLALIDYALRRRFSFITLKPMFNSKKFNSHLRERGLSDEAIKKINQTMTKINNVIKDELGSNFVIGHSYFAKASAENFDEWFSKIIKYEIVPLLEEYFFGDEEKIMDLLDEMGFDHEYNSH